MRGSCTRALRARARPQHGHVRVSGAVHTDGDSVTSQVTVSQRHSRTAAVHVAHCAREGHCLAQAVNDSYRWLQGKEMTASPPGAGNEVRASPRPGPQAQAAAPARPARPHPVPSPRVLGLGPQGQL